MPKKRMANVAEALAIYKQITHEHKIHSESISHRQCLYFHNAADSLWKNERKKWKKKKK